MGGRKGIYNPLPPEEVGIKLLVKLQAERVREKLGLKEAWEEEDGWRFDDLCAVVAAAIAASTADEWGDHEAAGRMLAQRRDTVTKILKQAKLDRLFPVDRPEPKPGKGTKLPIFELLVLGLGHLQFPTQPSKKLSVAGGLAGALADLLEIPSEHVKAEWFQRPLRQARDEYAEHLDCMQLRSDKGYGPRAKGPNPAESGRMFPRSQLRAAQLLRQVSPAVRTLLLSRARGRRSD